LEILSDDINEKSSGWLKQIRQHFLRL